MILNGEDYQQVQKEDLEECVGEFFLNLLTVDGCVWKVYAHFITGFW